MRYYYIESNVLHDLYLIEKFYPAKFFSIHSVNTSGLNLNFEKGISMKFFRRRLQVSPMHCDVECFDCDRLKSQTMYISSVSRSYYYKHNRK